MSDRPTLPLRLTHRGLDTPVLELGGVDITNYVAADGLTIEYTGGDTFGPTVTIKFNPIGLDLDLDIAMLQRIIADARTKGGE